MSAREQDSSERLERIFDLRDYADPAFLDRLYSELYLPSFPITHEQEDPDVWAPLLWDLSGTGGRPLLHLLVANRRGRPAPGQIDGFIFAEYFRESACGLLTYVAVNQKLRQSGLGNALLRRAVEVLDRDAQNQGSRLQAVFGEVNDPRRVSADHDSIDPNARVKIMNQLGARVVPISYVQPTLRTGIGNAEELFLVAFPLTDGRPVECLQSDVVIQFLNEFYRALKATQSEAAALRRAAKDLGADTVRLRAFEDLLTED